MSLRSLALVPLAWAAVVVAVTASVLGTASEPAALRVGGDLGKLLSLAGLWAAAFAYHKGDYLRRAWFLIGLGLVLLFTRSVLSAPLFDGWSDDSLAVVRGAALLLGNVSSVIGIWMLARAWKVGGIELPGARVARRVVVLVAFVLAVALTGPSLVSGGRRVLNGELLQLLPLVSPIADLISLVLIAPLLFTALALQGGILRWPWVFFSTGSLLWLFFDAVGVLATPLGVSPDAVTLVRELIRALAVGYIFAAGMAQRMAIVQMRRDAVA
jgi:hypothetical protein